MEKVIVSLPCGKISAYRDGNLIRARGIRYATAKRFAKPRQVASWKETLDCTQPACTAMQNPSPLEHVTGKIEKGRPQSEDCLHLTVAAPVDAKKAPVMVFIHGGAYLSGGGDTDAYSPHELARKGVVGVSLTNRLGIFGYLRIKDVAPANLGVYDHIEALRWIQTNIHAFGGDPDNVTLFGQSAGGDTIYCLAVADGTEGLFHRGIIQSAPFGRFEDPYFSDMTLMLSDLAAEKMTGVDPYTMEASDLLKLTNDLIGASFSTKSRSLLIFGPELGQTPLPDKVEAQKRFMEVSKKIPFMLGYTADEGTAFSPPDAPATEVQRLNDLFHTPTDKLVADMTAVTGKKPATYVFNWFAESNRNHLKATHCLELAFLLGDWETNKEAGMVGGYGSKEMVAILGDKVKGLWVAFARGHDFSRRHLILDENFNGL